MDEPRAKTDLEKNNLQLQNRLFTRFLSKDVPPLLNEEERLFYPEPSANFIYRIFFWWIHPIFQVGYKRTLTPQDLFKLPDELKVETMTRTFNQHFSNELARAKVKHIKKKCLIRGETMEKSSVDEEADLIDFKISDTLAAYALFKTFFWEYLLACLFIALANTGQTLIPLLSKKLIQYVELKALGMDEGVGVGIGYAIGSSALGFVAGTFMNHFFYRSMLTGVQAKSVLIQSMLQKSFVLSEASKHKFPSGKITSLMGTDVARIDFAIGFQPILIVFPIPIVISIAILVVNIGVSAVIGIVVTLLFVVMIGVAMAPLMSYRKKANKYTDLRIGSIKEALINLKMIKYYCWEVPYHNMIADYRTKEMKIIYKIEILKNITTSFAMSFTVIVSMIVFLVLHAIDAHRRDPASIFSSISLFNIITQQVFYLPIAASAAADAFVGLKRVGNFLASSDISPTLISETREDGSGLALQIKDGNFAWETFEEEEPHLCKEEKKNKDKGKKALRETKPLTYKSEKTLTKANSTKYPKMVVRSNCFSDSKFTGLKDINISIKKKEFVVITGAVGSGKSSLLNAMSGLMRKTSGSVVVNGSQTICASPPWIQNTTVKENITFGSKLDEKKYKEILYACALESDLYSLSAGDMTEIGERGITLSGGQKARISLARAIYKDSDIIFMDDVLSAVDAGVGRHIMDACILNLLKDKTRILVTHQVSLIEKADKVIFLTGDGTVDAGTLEELKSRRVVYNQLVEGNHSSVYNDGASVQQRPESKEESDHKNFASNNFVDGKLVEEEEKTVNGISFSVYKKYISIGSGGFTSWIIVPLILLSISLATFCMVFADTWLSFWIEHKFDRKSEEFYIGLYVMFSILAFVFLATEFTILVFLTTTASIKLNIKAMKNILMVPMSFVDVTPIGRIINRFTKDTDVMDNELGTQIRFLIFLISFIIGTIVLCVIYLPWFAIALPPMVLIFVGSANYYQASAREIKRLEAIQRSQVFNNFEETLTGLETIKAFKIQSVFLMKSSNFINKVNEAAFLMLAAERWLGINLDIVATIFTLLITLLCVFRVFNISPASVGLLLAYVLGIASQLPLLIRTYTKVENEMNSVERLINYAYDLPQEASFEGNGISPPPEWPQEGNISFKNVSFSYRPGLRLALKDISFSIKCKERIGICGRTGAGKSSIMTALYRLSELESGSIIIDGIDIATVGLSNLRSNLSIIPQDPVLFAGTIRKNLDPFNKNSDEKLWDTLRRTGLIESESLDVVKHQVHHKGDNIMHKFHLDKIVEEGGANFSLGERQLLAFARALVRESKILILDEATSSVDYETDVKIQNTIIKEFSHTTILCVAHRLKTIINYKKILVLDKGEVKEFDSPWRLYNTDNGIFRQMCDNANIEASDFET